MKDADFIDYSMQMHSMSPDQTVNTYQNLHSKNHPCAFCNFYSFNPPRRLVIYMKSNKNRL